MPGLNAVRATGLLAAALALTGAGLVAAAPAGPLLDSRPAVAPLGLVAFLAVLFFLADLCLLHVEVRREAYSLTLSGVPLALGVLLADSRELVAARVLGSAAAFAVQHVTREKAGYNLGAYAFEAALDVFLVHLLLTPGPRLTVQMAVGCFVILVAVEQLMSLLVVEVIRWHQGRFSNRQSAVVHLPSLVCSALATTAAYGLLLLSQHGPLGAIVMTVFFAAAAAAYRAFQVLHRRHQSLGHVHGCVALNDGDASVPELAGRMLEQIRSLMRAGTAELVLTDPDAPLHLVVHENGVPRAVGTVGGRRAEDRPLAGVLRGGAPALLSRTTRDPAARAWLRNRGARDAVVVPLAGPGGVDAGAVLVTDRLGDTGSFNGEDQTLLQTLAGHLSVAVSSGTRRDRLRYEATHDVLTGLGNRALLDAAIRAELAGAGRAGAVVLLLDLDRFKEVNDTLGHHVGDALLTVVATRLVAALPATATVARLGGDEFAALVPMPDEAAGTATTLPGTAERAAALAGAIAGSLALPVVLPEANLSTQASIGVALVTGDCTASHLLRHADTAMYAAKETQAGIVVYTDELDRGRLERLALLADLHLALERDELTVCYQPKLDLGLDRITSVEALVRWQHPRLGTLGPDVFIPLAEANGLVAPLTRVVLAEALRQCAAWRAAGLDLAVAVNLSARTVHDPGLPEQVNAALLRAGVPASRLILEITESAVMDDPLRAVPILERIAAIGISLSLDDFGTGYSSLSYLQRLPVREVKIDRSFVTGLTAGDTTSQVLVNSIINLGRSLGLQVVAEGVEDAPTLELLRELGCHYVQGYHVGKPVPGSEVPSQVGVYGEGGRRLRAVAG